MSVAVPDEGKVVAKNLLKDSISGHIRLAKAAITPGDNTVLSDLTEADFGGYAPIAFSLDSNGLDAVAHFAWIKLAAASFTKSGSAPTNDIFHWYVTIAYSSSEFLYCVGTYSPALGMYTSGDNITVQPRLKFPLGT